MGRMVVAAALAAGIAGLAGPAEAGSLYARGYATPYRAYAPVVEPIAGVPVDDPLNLDLAAMPGPEPMLAYRADRLPRGVIYNVPGEPVFASRGPAIRARY